MLRDLIEEYARGCDRPAQAIAGLSPEELNAIPEPGTWSIQQIILHLMDSDLIAADRMKRVIAEDNPSIIGYDESAFARNLHYERLDVSMACELFRLNRLLMAQLLRQVPAAAFDRAGLHNEAGQVRLRDLLQTYVDHLAHHLKFVDKKRQLLLSRPS